VWETSSSTFGASRTVSLIAETKKYDVKNYYRRTEKTINVTGVLLNFVYALSLLFVFFFVINELRFKKIIHTVCCQ